MVETVEKVSCPSSCERKDFEFFKVFLPEFSSHELVLPPAFINILEKPLPNQVSLLDEIGRLWCVETKTQDKLHVVFKKGWQILADNLSLQFGDFLVFRYDGDSRFYVTIFANDGCKKDLGVVTTRVSVLKEPVGKPVNVFTKPERREDCGKRKREPENASTIIKCEPEHRVSTGRKVNRARDTCGISWVPEMKQEGIEEPVNKPKNPHFVRNITHDSVRKMVIPTTFLKGNGIELEEDIELCDENGKKWPMKIVNQDKRIKFSNDSWLCFCKSHKLRKTNKCLFEFIVASNGRCNQIQVRVFRGKLLTITTKNCYQVLAM